MDCNNITNFHLFFFSYFNKNMYIELCSTDKLNSMEVSSLMTENKSNIMWFYEIYNKLYLRKKREHLKVE